MPRLLRAGAVTVYNALGEIDGRRAWRRTVLDGVRIETVEGIDAGLVPRPDVKASVYIHGQMRGYAEPEAFGGTEGWTLREGDSVVSGEGPAEPPRDALRILRVHTLTLFGTRVHHRQVDLT